MIEINFLDHGHVLFSGQWVRVARGDHEQGRSYESIFGVVDMMSVHDQSDQVSVWLIAYVFPRARAAREPRTP